MIILWAEGGSRIGSGHLNRSLSIYNILKGEFPVYFYAEDSESIEFYEKADVKIVKYDDLKNNEIFLITDLRFPEEHDSLSDIKKFAFAHLSINDMGLSQIDSDIVFDGHIKNLIPYKKKEGVKYFLGPKYFLLKTKFRHFNKARKKIRKRAKKVYISLGGWFDVDILRKFAEILLKEGFSVVASWGFGKTKRERRLFKKSFPSVHIVVNGSYIPRKYYEADIAILSGGISFYEAAATGTPSILFYKDHYQKFTVESFLEKGFGFSGGNLFDFKIDYFLELIRKLKYDFSLREQHSQTGKSLVDGLGLLRLKNIVKEEYRRFL